MWVVLPKSIASASSLARPVSIYPSPSQFQTLASSVWSRSKVLPVRSWVRAWKTAAWTKLLSGATYEPSQSNSIVERWISSTVGPRARISRLPDPVLASLKDQGPASSSTCFAEWSSADRLWSFSRTSKPSSRKVKKESPPRPPRWPKLASMRTGSVFAHPTLALPTDALDGSASRGGEISSLPDLTPILPQWQTPASFLGKYRRQVGQTERAEKLLPAQAEDQEWPTPRTITGGAESAERKQELGRSESGGGDLQSKATEWMTPSVRDFKDTPGMASTGTNPDGSHRERSDQLARQVFHCFHLDQPLLKPGEISSSSTPNSLPQWQKPGVADGIGGHLTSGGNRDGELLLPGQAKQWPTPRAGENGNDSGSKQRLAQGANPGLKDMAKTWPTPCSQDGPNGGPSQGEDRLPAKVSHRPTPVQTDGLGARNETSTRPLDSRHHSGTTLTGTTLTGTTLTDAIQPTGAVTKKTAARLNPNFVEHLMGWPIGWTDFAPVETASWRFRAQSHCESFCRGLGLSFPLRIQVPDMPIRSNSNPDVNRILRATKGNMLFQLFYLPAHCEKTMLAGYETARACVIKVAGTPPCPVVGESLARALSWFRDASIIAMDAGKELPPEAGQFMRWAKELADPNLFPVEERYAGRPVPDEAQEFLRWNRAHFGPEEARREAAEKYGTSGDRTADAQAPSTSSAQAASGTSQANSASSGS